MFQRDAPVFISMAKLKRDGPTSRKAERGEVTSGKIHGMGKVERMKFEPTGPMYSNCQN